MTTYDKIEKGGSVVGVINGGVKIKIHFQKIKEIWKQITKKRRKH